MTPTHPRSPTPTQLPDLRHLGPMSDGQRSTFVGLSRDNHAFMRETRTVQVMRCVPLSFASPLSLSQDMDARRSYLEGDRKEVNESLASVHGFASSCSKGSRHLQTGCWRMTKCSRRGRPWLSLRSRDREPLYKTERDMALCNSLKQRFRSLEEGSRKGKGQQLR